MNMFNKIVICNLRAYLASLCNILTNFSIYLKVLCTFVPASMENTLLFLYVIIQLLFLEYHSTICFS